MEYSAIKDIKKWGLWAVPLLCNSQRGWAFEKEPIFFQIRFNFLIPLAFGIYILYFGMSFEKLK